jgi:hypothetical protein
LLVASDTALVSRILARSIAHRSPLFTAGWCTNWCSLQNKSDV